MSFSQSPTLPAELTDRMPNDLPLHPHLKLIRASRGSSDATDIAFSQNMSEYRTELYRLLDAERWKHSRTIYTLRSEVERREALERDFQATQMKCQQLANGWEACAKDYTRCDAGRNALTQEVPRLRKEVAASHAQCHTLLFQVAPVYIPDS
ncbi:hypothetical protein LTR49_027536, partial [Elasticomyces elasticus]